LPMTVLGARAIVVGVDALFVVLVVVILPA
jgi:hypothetical protein